MSHEQNERNGRDSKGRFQAGNTGGPGNPFGRRLAAMRQAILGAVTEEETAAVMRVLLAKAMEGDLAAIKLYIQYIVGKPKPAAEPDHVDVEEWELEKKMSVPAEDLAVAINQVPIATATMTTAATVPERNAKFLELLNETRVEETFDEYDPVEQAEFERKIEEKAALLGLPPLSGSHGREAVGSPSRDTSNGHRDAVGRPSRAHANGHRTVNRPSLPHRNGDRAAAGSPSLGASNGHRGRAERPSPGESNGRTRHPSHR